MATTLTTRIGGLLRKMKPARPVAIDYNEHGDATGAGAEAETGAGAGDGSAGRGSITRRVAGEYRDARVSQLQDGFEEVVGLVQDVRRHLDQQADRSERLLGLMSDLPDAIRTLPESNRNQARMVEAMNGHLARSDRHAEDLNEALGGLARSNEHQGQVLGLIQQQIESSRQTDEQMVASFGTMNETLRQLGLSNHASAKSMALVAEQSKMADGRMKELVQRNSRQMLIMSAANWVLAAAALGLALFAVLSL